MREVKQTKEMKNDNRRCFIDGKTGMDFVIWYDSINIEQITGIQIEGNVCGIINILKDKDGNYKYKAYERDGHGERTKDLLFQITGKIDMKQIWDNIELFDSEKEIKSFLINGLIDYK